MEGLAELANFQNGVLGLNTAAVLLLYKIHRDVRQVVQTQKEHWHWIKRLRHWVKPDAFPLNDDEPQIDP